MKKVFYIPRQHPPPALGYKGSTGRWGSRHPPGRGCPRGSSRCSAPAPAARRPAAGTALASRSLGRAFAAHRWAPPLRRQESSGQVSWSTTQRTPPTRTSNCPATLAPGKTSPVKATTSPPVPHPRAKGHERTACPAVGPVEERRVVGAVVERAALRHEAREAETTKHLYADREGPKAFRGRDKQRDLAQIHWIHAQMHQQHTSRNRIKA